MDSIDDIMDSIEDTIRSYTSKLSLNSLQDVVYTLNAFYTTEEDPIWIQHLSTYATIASMVSSYLYGISIGSDVISIVLATGSLYSGYIVLGNLIMIVLRTLSRSMQEDVYIPLNTRVNAITNHVTSVDHRNACNIRTIKALEAKISSMETIILDRITSIELKHSLCTSSKQLVSDMEDTIATLDIFTGITSDLDDILQSINTNLSNVISSIQYVEDNVSIRCIHLSHALKDRNITSESNIIQSLQDIGRYIGNITRLIQCNDIGVLQQDLKRLDDNIETLLSYVNSLPQGFTSVNKVTN